MAPRLVALRTACVFLALLVFSNVADAAPRTWTFSGLTLADGRTVTGSFVYDGATNTYSSVNVVTSGPGGTTYTQTGLGGGVVQSGSTVQLFPAGAASGSLSGVRNLYLNFLTSLTTAGTTSNVSGGQENSCPNATCTSPGPPSTSIRAGGTVTAPATFTVTYNGNSNTSGTVPVDAEAYEVGALVTVKANTGALARAGYTFTGWNTAADGSGTSYAATGAVTFNMGKTNVTLFAQWVSYRVTYNGNGNTGGTVPVDALHYGTGDTVTVKANTDALVKTGFTFAGWNTAADGSGTTYAATGAATFAMGAANVTLYARWTAATTYTVTYNGNGHTGGAPPVDAGTYETGTLVTVKANTGALAKTGSNFVNWNTAANGSGTSYAATGGATFTMGAANVTLFAQWEPVPTAPSYRVTYDANGATGGSAPTDDHLYTEDEAAPVQANTGGLVKTGFVFGGWNTAANGSGTGYAATGNATITIRGANVTLYAKWSVANTSGPSPTGTGTITATMSGSDPSCGFTSQQFIRVTGDPGSPPPGTAPAGVTFPHGLFDFTVSGCTTRGGTVTFRVTYPQPLPAGTQLWKYGPTPGGGAPHWYTLPATISGNTMTFSITDGGHGDDDLDPNGTISDPDGPGVPAAVPTMGEWALGLLGLLLLGLGAQQMRRRAHAGVLRE